MVKHLIFFHRGGSEEDYEADAKLVASLKLKLGSGYSVLRILDLESTHIREVEGLDALIQLQSLDLENNEMAGISNLDALTKLQFLKIANNYISDIKGLNALTRLQYLDLQQNYITRIKELRDLVYFPKLQTLRLYGIRENDLNVPEELFGTGASDNCLEDLQEYFDELMD